MWSCRAEAWQCDIWLGSTVVRRAATCDEASLITQNDVHISRRSDLDGVPQSTGIYSTYVITAKQNWDQNFRNGRRFWKGWMQIKNKAKRTSGLLCNVLHALDRAFGAVPVDVTTFRNVLSWDDEALCHNKDNCRPVVFVLSVTQSFDIRAWKCLHWESNHIPWWRHSSLYSTCVSLLHRNKTIVYLLQINDFEGTHT